MEDELGTCKDITRELRNSSLSPLNRLCSIVYDASFVDRIVSLLPSKLPVGGNWRAGRWYVRAEKASFECCFKSADGHYGQWNFSFWRNNLQLLRLLFAKGGAVVVDTTRQGKRFPDSLSKTIPIWCFIINTVLGDFGVWREDNCNNTVCLPEWVPKEERHWILERSKKWLTMIREHEEFQSVLLELVSEYSVRKPLKPIWLSRDQPHIEQVLSELVNISFIPVLCVSVSSPNDNQSWLTHSLKSGETYGFRYIQGAGDDEESWSCGLFPELFWRYEEELLSTDTALIKECIKDLLERVKSVPASIGKFSRHMGHIQVLRAGGAEEHTKNGVDLFWGGWVSMEFLPLLYPYCIDVHIVLSVGYRNSPLIDGLPTVLSKFGDTCQVVCVNVVDRAGRLESKRFGLERALKQVFHYLDYFLQKKNNVMIWCPFDTDWSTCCVLTWLALRSTAKHPLKIVKEDNRLDQQIWLVDWERQETLEDKTALITLFWWLSLSFDLHAPSRSSVQQMHRFLWGDKRALQKMTLGGNFEAPK
ncbi:hypothetical protein GAYE_PCTG36G1012 [Galdieria yellowstonensis]|uniref:Rit1 N-terminal domain-containing protein n=1 Tax=Galdieria yellowstonensis TaxID=3028027 RepID=A0AAV9I3Q9_9RHOD|nr:hypothetical protein GAYE_PCTG36G1012 [Galdieria yellowstonensis]